MGRPATTPEFAKHLDAIRLAKQSADKAIRELEKTRKIQEKTRVVVQEMLLDHVGLCRDLLPKMDDLGEASSIVARAVQSAQRLQELCEKSLAQKPGEPPCAGLPPETCEGLERDLHVM